MRGRYSAVMVMAAAALAACGEQQNELPTSPEFKVVKPACDFTLVSQLTKNEFGNTSAEAGYAGDMKFAGAGTDGATYSGYLILKSVETKFDGQDAGNSLSTINASALAVALLTCMNIGGSTIPDASVFNSSLQYTGALGVRGLGATADHAPLQAHDGAWQLEPPGHFGTGGWQSDASWQDITTLKTSTGGDLTFGDVRLADALLIYGSSPTSGPDFSDDVEISTVFDWSTRAAAVFGDGGVLVGECAHESNFLQHNPKSSADVEVLGFVRPSCYQTGFGLGRDAEPRSFAERVFRLFSPAPAYAAAANSTGTGTTKSTLSPYQVIFPGTTLLVPPFQWKKSGYVVNTYFPQIDYQATTFGDTKFKQPYILVWLEATNNQGAKVLTCNNWAYTNAEGKVSFTKAYLNKAGGYTITTRTAGALTITPQGGQEITIPTVPPSDPQISPLINVKNSTSTPPDLCPSFKLGTDYTINADGTATVIHAPEAPGPNVIIAQ
jgi:hypothetical protein